MSAVPLTYTKESGRKDKPLDTLLGTQCCMCSCLRYLKKCKPFGKVSPGIITINPFPPLPCSTLSSTPPPPPPHFLVSLTAFHSFLRLKRFYCELSSERKAPRKTAGFFVSNACLMGLYTNESPLIVDKPSLPNQSPTLHLIPVRGLSEHDSEAKSDNAQYNKGINAMHQLTLVIRKLAFPRIPRRSPGVILTESFPRASHATLSTGLSYSPTWIKILILRSLACKSR